MRISPRASLAIVSVALLAFVLGATAYHLAELAASSNAATSRASSAFPDWQTYSSPSFGFSFMYPSEADVNPALSSLSLAVIENIPFATFPMDSAQKRFEASVQPLGQSYCDTEAKPIIIPKVLTVRGGTTFMSDSWQYSVGINSWEMSETYHAVRNNLCYAMRLRIFGKYGESVPRATYVISEEEQILEQITSTFQFVR